MTACQRCQDFGVLTSADARETFPCACRPDSSRWREAGIPDRYHHHELSRLPSAEVPLSRLFWGPPGRGKTRAAVGVLKRFARVRYGGRFVDMPALEEARRRAVTTREDGEPMPGDDLHEAPFLLLDDLCRNVRVTEFWEEYVTGLLRARYNAPALTTLFTSNFPIDGRPSMSSILGEYVSGRVLELCGDRIHDFSARKNWRAA